jgi:hypothetical protein
MAAIVDKSKDLFASVLSRAKSGDKTVIAAGAVAAAVAGYVVFKVAFAPGDGAAYENEHQKGFVSGFRLQVAPNKAVTVEKVTSKDIPEAANTLAAYNATAPMIVACASQVRVCLYEGFVHCSAFRQALHICDLADLQAAHIVTPPSSPFPAELD